MFVFFIVDLQDYINRSTHQNKTEHVESKTLEVGRGRIMSPDAKTRKNYFKVDRRIDLEPIFSLYFRFSCKIYMLS